MKKLHYLLTALITGILILASCTKNNEESVIPVLSVSSESITFEALPNGTQSITLTANVAWTATVRQDEAWLSITPTSGSGGETITISATENTSFTATRNATISFSGKEASASITAAQQAMNDFEVLFEDNTFRQFCLTNYDQNNDGKLMASEAAVVSGTINIDNKGITSLKGIEYFIALTELSCSENNLKSIDVTKNKALIGLYCHSNQLLHLDITKNTGLIRLNCSSNQLASLDISKNTKLLGIYCYGNQLTSLDISNNTALTYINCYSNKITALDVTKHPALAYLNCYNNKITALDVSKNTKLTGLRCDSNQLTSLDVSNNTSLTSLMCQINNLGTILDIRQNNKLTSFDCTSNKALQEIWVWSGFNTSSPPINFSKPATADYVVK